MATSPAELLDALLIGVEEVLRFFERWPSVAGDAVTRMVRQDRLDGLRDGCETDEEVGFDFGRLVRLMPRLAALREAPGVEDDGDG